MEIPGYKILGTVGQGGMALVYEAIQNSLHRKVALKVLSPALVADQEFCQRFLEEGKTVARLTHQNIVTIYDIGHHENNYFMSMEYINGGNLRARIEEGMSEQEVIRVARQIARALGYAHDHGFLHRDVKPHNILFRENGDAVLSDFGIAKNLSENSELTRTGKSLGSPLYMSPEQIRNELLDARSDLYSLGVVIYQMLTGYAPYLASTAESTTRMHLSCPVPDLPAELGKFQPLIRRLLAKRRNNRFLNAWELIESLDAISNSAEDENPSTELVHEPIENTVMMDKSDVPTAVDRSVPEKPDERVITQELDEVEVAQALKNSETSKIYATRDDGLISTNSLTGSRDDAGSTTAPQSTPPGSRKLALKVGFAALFLFIAALIYPQLRSHFNQTGAPANMVEGDSAEGVSESNMSVSRPNDLQIAFGDQPAVIATPSEAVEQLPESDQSQTDTVDSNAGPQPSAEAEPEQATLAALAPDEEEIKTPPTAGVAKPEVKSEKEPVIPAKVEEPAPEIAAAKPLQTEKAAEEEVKELVNEKVKEVEEVSESLAAPGARKSVAFSSLRDPGLVKVNGEYWISHELENLLRRNGQRILRLGDGSLSVSMAQNDLFAPDADTFAVGATERLDQLSYVVRNYSGFTVDVSASRSGFGEQQIMDIGQMRAQRVADYLRLQMDDASRLLLGDTAAGSSVAGGSVEFRLVPVPVL